MNAARLLEYFDRIAEAPNAVSRLRKFILDLAVRGKLAEQEPNDEPASELLKAIQEEKARLEKQGIIKSTKKVPPVEGDEVEFSLPSSWLWTRLNDITQYIQRGKSPKYSNEEGPLVISQKCVHWTGLNLGLARYITKESISEYDESRFLRQGDLLWNSTGTGTIGRIVRFSLDCDRLVCDSHVTIVRCLLVSPEYVRLWLMSDHVYGNIEELASGSTNQVELTAQMAINQVLPLPPLAEQHRIVAKVDELMALCDRLEASQAKRESRRDKLASASLKRIGQPEGVGNGEEFRENVRFHLHHLPRLATRPEHVKELRQTILNLAVRGKLVPQEKNEATERSKLTKYVVEERKLSGFRQGIPSEDFGSLGIDISKYNFPASWEVMKLSEIALIIVDCPHSTPRWVESGVLCVRTNQFKPGFLDLSASRYVSSETYIERIQRLEPICGDILYSREGGILGVACRVPEDVRLCLGQRMMLFRMSSVYLPKFAELVLNSPLITELARQNTTGGAAPRVNVALIKSYPMPIPPLAEQHRIVSKVDELMNLCDQLEGHLATNRTNQSRLLEATLCDALGVTCLPVGRPSRPAPSPTRVAATHTEQSSRPIAPHPAPVQTPTAAVQGSLVEQPTPQVGKPRAANVDVPGAILAQMQPGQEYSRAQLAEALGLSVYEWNVAIRELKESGRVVQAGERRGARYQLKNAE